jgi:hypothetical protein
MTERIKLTEDNFYLHPSDTYENLRIEILGKNVSKKELQSQILADQEKAEKYDEIPSQGIGLLNAFDWLDKNNIQKIPELMQENRQLKKENEKLSMDKAILGSFQDDVKAFFTMNDVDDLEQLDKEFNNLKQKLEKIGKYIVMRDEEEYGTHHDWSNLRKILGEKS